MKIDMHLDEEGLRQLVRDVRANNEQEAEDNGGEEKDDMLRELMVDEIAGILDVSRECAYDIVNHYS